MIVLISGAAGGIGLATANAYASSGATVIAMDLPGSPLKQSIAELGELNGHVIAMEGDVTCMADWQRATTFATDNYGGIDVLVNNAGIVEPGTRIEDLGEDLFDQVIAVNVKGSFLGMKAVIPAMRRRGGGAIVNVSSISGFGGNAVITAYTASKHAVVGMTKCAALDLAEYGIRVNAVCPAPIDTPMIRTMEARKQQSDPEFDAASIMSAGIPLTRLGLPEEVAASILFLTSSQASFTTGISLPVDGGVLAN
ncbi:MAG: SDR family oxidoreductase [Pseudomonadota bacterium]